MQKQTEKKAISIILMLAMLMGILPAVGLPSYTALAASPPTRIDTKVTEIDALPVISVAANRSLSIGTSELSGAGLTLTFTLTLDSQYPFPVSVGYRTLSGSARAGVNYTETSGRATIPANSTSTNVTVQVLQYTPNSADTRHFGSINFIMQFHDPVDATLEPSGGSSIVNSKSFAVDIVNTDNPWLKTISSNETWDRLSTTHPDSGPVPVTFGAGYADRRSRDIDAGWSFLNYNFLQPSDYTKLINLLSDSNASGVEMSMKVESLI